MVRMVPGKAVKLRNIEVPVGVRRCDQPSGKLSPLSRFVSFSNRWKRIRNRTPEILLLTEAHLSPHEL